MLMVLTHPEIPLHNNPAELGARQRVRKRDVSFGPRTAEGTNAWDTFMTLAATARKLGVSFYAYVHDRITTTNQLPRLGVCRRENKCTRSARFRRVNGPLTTARPLFCGQLRGSQPLLAPFLVLSDRLLDALITTQAKALDLGPSWNTS